MPFSAVWLLRRSATAQVLLSALVLSSAATALQELKATGCPESCYCSLSDDAGGDGGELVVRCSGMLLTEVPRNIPNATRRLYLDYNQLASIPADAFLGLPLLAELDLSHNKLARLEPGSLAALGPSLQSLDLSSNQLQELDPEALGGLQSKTNLTDNPWHCDCALQEAMPKLELEPASLASVVCHSTVPEDAGATGKSFVMVAQELDLCAGLKRTTDVAMLVTMFGWFAMVISYLVYYVRANQEDARRHLEYLKSLPNKQTTPEETSITTSTMV
ncbi:leucine-rich repeat-containing protein 3-like [Alosa alosa]|uniref:leucine-rich repeat-containing protein 3-like n=1 Tax=Alosa alosa TaxID=278164 RepID=UPI0020152F5F|nr:leucine-rich repeat-containing protein 3-like [Alosa alosa]